MNPRSIIFHPALAPYRVDFFNSLSEAFDAEVYFEFHDPLEQKFDQEALRQRLRFTPRYLRPGFLGIKNLRLEVLAILWRRRPEVAIVSEYNLLGLLVCLFKLLFHWKMRILTICDDNKRMAERAGRVKRLTRYVMLHLLQGVVLADEQAYRWYQRQLPYRAHYAYFPIIQPETLFRQRLAESLPTAELLAERYALKGKQVVLYVGRLAEVKQVSLLLEAIQRLPKASQSVRLLIVGDGPLREELTEAAAEGIASGLVRFVGKQEGLTLMAYYNLAQLFVLPSRYEPFGTVVNEALLAGCFTLCSQVAGAACLIEPGRNGALFDPTDPDSLGQALRKALAETPPLSAVGLKPNRMTLSYATQFKEMLAALGC